MPSKSRKKFIVACALGGLLVVVALSRFVKPPDFSPEMIQKTLNEERLKAEQELKHRTEAERQQRIKAAKDKVTKLTNDAYGHMKEIVNKAHNKTDYIIGRHEAGIPDLTTKVNEKLQGYSNAVGLVRRMAEDKVRGTQKTQDYLQEAFRPVMESEVKTEAELRQALKDCAYELNIEAAKLQADTANVLNVEGFNAADLGVEDALTRLYTTTTKQSFEASIMATSATVEVVVEALLIKTTFETISKLLAKAVAKEAGSLVVGAGGAAIPIVYVITTIIAVGGDSMDSV